MDCRCLTQFLMDSKYSSSDLRRSPLGCIFTFARFQTKLRQNPELNQNEYNIKFHSSVHLMYYQP